MTVCTVCGGSGERTFEKEGFWILSCVGCGHRYAEVEASPKHVAETYDDDYFFGGGAGYPNYLEESEVVRAHGARYARRIRRWTEPGDVLDVGAAAGFFLDGLTDGGWRGMGIEPNGRLAAYARSEVRVDVQQGALEDLPNARQFDLVTMVQVLGHFLDPRRALAAAAGATRPGGHWLIETWDRTSLSARVLGPRWHEYSPPSVLHWFSRRGVERLAADFGFEPVAHGRPVKWLGAKHARSLLSHKLGNSALGRAAEAVLGRIPAGVALPYPPEDLFWVLLRHSGTGSSSPRILPMVP